MSAQAARQVEPVPESRVRVALDERAYTIHIGTGLLANLGALLRAQCSSDRCAIVTNPTVARYYREPAVQALREAGIRPDVIEIPDGEAFKTIDSLATIYDRLIEAQFERGHPIVALGGGVVGDVAGFAAATYLRGVPFIQVPTTLLAQVDSSVGGKTGINHASGKNLIGAFYQPRLVVADLASLASLPRREFVAGLVEVIKYGVILDGELFAYIERHLDAILHLDPERLLHIVTRSCQLKAQVVEADEREEGLRAVLNFGHTLAHAVESLTDYRLLLHGEAVAIGMAFAAAVSAERGICDTGTRDRIHALLGRLGVAVDMPNGLAVAAVSRAVRGDKKARDGKVKFVCVEKLGHTRFEYLSSQEIADYAARRPWGGV